MFGIGQSHNVNRRKRGGRNEPDSTTSRTRYKGGAIRSKDIPPPSQARPGRLNKNSVWLRAVPLNCDLEIPAVD
jgi:hypothetical protein